MLAVRLDLTGGASYERHSAMWGVCICHEAPTTTPDVHAMRDNHPSTRLIDWVQGVEKSGNKLLSYRPWRIQDTASSEDATDTRSRDALHSSTANQLNSRTGLDAPCQVSGTRYPSNPKLPRKCAPSPANQKAYSVPTWIHHYYPSD